MTERSERWQRVAEAVKDRMKARGIRRQVDLVRISKLSDPTVRVFMTGKLRANDVDEASRTTICAALGWTSDSIERILSGGHPLDLRAALRTAETEVGSYRQHIEQLRAGGHPQRDIDRAERLLSDSETRAAMYTRELAESESMLEAAASWATSGDVADLRNDLTRLRESHRDLDAVVRRLVRDVERLKDADASSGAIPTVRQSDPGDPQAR